jgi:energy-coupling factor transporter ATP-binding protein EcfA2
MLTQLSAGEWKLDHITPLNIILGRNGSGKSRLLRGLAALGGQGGYQLRYLSPERAGTFMADAGVENTVRQNKTWVEDNRKQNQVGNFKPASATRLKELSYRFGVRVQTDMALRQATEKTFETEVLAKINGMLTNVAISMDRDQSFIFTTQDGATIDSASISSGESEVLALATEVLHFLDSCVSDKTNVLLLDEPDVHLHPDLQARLARFLIAELNELDPSIYEKTIVCIATHSTPLICELARFSGCSIGTKSFTSTAVVQNPISEQLRKLAPFFGHPLSQCISDDVPLIVEGEDDERVWQQAASTAQGRLKLFPCLAGTVTEQTEVETACDQMLSGLYDTPRAISIRDGDGIRANLNAVGCVQRFRLKCYAIENLLVTDEVLATCRKDWASFVAAGKVWCAANAGHSHVAQFNVLLDSNDRLRDKKIKDIRQLIVGALDSNKPWTTLIGQVLGGINNSSARTSEHGIVEYVGLPALVAVGLVT